MVQRFKVVDNSDFSPTRLTVPRNAPYPSFRKELSLLPISSSEDRYMALHVFVFLLVFFLILFLVLLWRFYWLHLQLSPFKAGVVRTTVQRLRHRHARHWTAPPFVSPALLRRM